MEWGGGVGGGQMEEGDGTKRLRKVHGVTGRGRGEGGGATRAQGAKDGTPRAAHATRTHVQVVGLTPATCTHIVVQNPQTHTHAHTRTHTHTHREHAHHSSPRHIRHSKGVATPAQKQLGGAVLGTAGGGARAREASPSASPLVCGLPVTPQPRYKTSAPGPTTASNTHIHTCTHTTHARTYTQTHTFTQTCTQTHTHTHRHTHTSTHTHERPRSPPAARGRARTGSSRSSRCGVRNAISANTMRDFRPSLKNSILRERRGGSRHTSAHSRRGAHGTAGRGTQAWGHAPSQRASGVEQG